MEVVAWFTHKYVMHGFLWVLHKDHHIPHNKKLEKNDWFAVLFALPALILLWTGIDNNNPILLAPGIGIALYGVAYFLFHDVYVHHRIKGIQISDNQYLRATGAAHLDHHMPHSHRNYGFLIAPLFYYRKERSPKE